MKYRYCQFQYPTKSTFFRHIFRPCLNTKISLKLIYLPSQKTRKQFFSSLQKQELKTIIFLPNKNIIRQYLTKNLKKNMSEDPAIKAFQVQLKNKLQFKASSKVSIDAVLFKAFKFFDLYNNGFLPRNDFFKAIAKCGVVVDTHDLDTIYRAYDAENTGKIDYRNFIENLLFRSSAGGSQEDSVSSQMGRSQVSGVSHGQQQHKNKQQQPQNKQQQEEYGETFSNRSPSQKLKQSSYHQKKTAYHNISSLEEIIDTITLEIRGDGISGLLNFANQLKATDIQRLHLINKQKLAPILTYLPENNIRTLIAHYNPNKFQQINYAELIYSLKGNMNLQRQALVDDLFHMLDVEQQGEIQIAKIIAAYKNRSEIGAFKRSIDLYCKFQSIDDGIFTDQDFNDFFEFISFSFREDASFGQFVKIGFYTGEIARSTSSRRSSKRQFEINRENSQKGSHMMEAVQQQQPQQHLLKPNQTANFKKTNKIQQKNMELKDSAYRQLDFNHHEEDEEKRSQAVSQAVSRRSQQKSTLQQLPGEKEINMILMRMKKTLAGKGTRGFLQFQKLLRNADTDLDGCVNMDQFKSVIKQQKIDITNVEAVQIFSIFDQQKSGRFNYQRILATLKGQIPAQRFQIIKRMWEKVKLNPQETTFARLKSSLNFRNHPDVQNGRKYDDQIWNEIQQTLLMIQDLNEIPRRDTITRDNFEEYAENLSLSVADDQLFQSIALNFWKIGSVVRIQEQYAGSRKTFDPSKKGYLQDHHRYALNGGTVSQNAPFGTFSTPTMYTTEHNRL